MENDPATESSTTIWAMEREPKAGRVRFDQLTTEIRAIYIAIVKLEAICTQQIAHYQQNNTPITPEQCVSLVELHKATIHEFSDFFLATQHPVAAHSRTLRECCLKYNMPQRLWLRVNSLFGLLRAHLPDLREHMMSFVSLSFSLYTVLYENAPVFGSTWSECLGDVARYGMASDIGLEERCIWAGASRMWYLRAADLDPGAGRLQHHLAILAMTEPMAQLFHFIKGLCAATPFGAARESIATLLDPVFSKQMGQCQTLDIATAKVHGMVIRNYDDEAFGMALLDYNLMLGDGIVADPAAWNSFGYHLAIVNVCSLLSYCSESNPITQALGGKYDQAKPFAFEATELSVRRAFERALAINIDSAKMMLQHDDISPLLSYLHVWLAFLYGISQLPDYQVAPRIFNVWPWEALVLVLDRGGRASSHVPDPAGTEFHLLDKRPPLPEDYAMRGLVWAGRYFPEKWFAEDTRDFDERVVEMEWMREERERRCAWLAGKLAGRREFGGGGMV